jgi:hypothetical protein
MTTRLGGNESSSSSDVRGGGGDEYHHAHDHDDAELPGLVDQKPQQQEHLPPRPQPLHIPDNIDDDDEVDNSNDSDRRRQYSRTILEEIQEVLPQSYMIFLIADLRLMSGTGRIRTRYETLTIDSDLVPKTTANEVACMTPDLGYYGPTTTIAAAEEEEKIDEDGQSLKTGLSVNKQPTPNIPSKSIFSKHTSRERSMHDRASEGLSPRQVMAILLLELRDTFLDAKEDLDESTSTNGVKGRGQKQPSSSLTEDFRNYRNTKKSQRNIEDSSE